MKLLTFYNLHVALLLISWYILGSMKQTVKNVLSTIVGFYRLDPAGFLVGTLFYCFALTPSLIPRTAFLTGIVAGISFAIGYGLGVLVGIGLRWIGLSVRIPKQYRRRIWLVLVAIVVSTWLVFGILATGWQNEVRKLVGVTELQGIDLFTVWLWAFMSATLSLLFGRGIGRGYRFIRKQVGRVIPKRIGTVISIFVTVLIAVFVFNGVLFRGFRTVSNNIFGAADQRTDKNIKKPTSVFRSGSPVSSVAWESLGRQGRTFVASAPSTSSLAKFHDASLVKEPIRIYVGSKSASSIRERATLAVNELKRTGAFSRKVLVVATPTGTGWLEPEAADSLEYVWGGDTAIVATQYSYLPSWISFLVDQEIASETGKVLFNEVYDVWRTLPADQRPKLYAYGLSLGSFGSQAAFSGQADLSNRTNGALFVGSPSFSQPWRYFTDNRSSSSSEVLPTYRDSETVRFAATATDINASGWQEPRVLYLQHASDPVIWWSYDIIWHQPDWLREPRGVDVTSRMRWYPFVTFLQLTVDQALGLSVPSGHGHDYSATMPDAWATLGAPSDWTSAKAADLRELISR